MSMLGETDDSVPECLQRPLSVCDLARHIWQAIHHNAHNSQAEEVGLTASQHYHIWQSRCSWFSAMRVENSSKHQQSRRRRQQYHEPAALTATISQVQQRSTQLAKALGTLCSRRDSVLQPGQKFESWHIAPLFASPGRLLISAVFAASIQ